MKQDDFKKDLTIENEIENIRDWRNEHGKPDFEYLQSLATDGSIEALNKLRSVAEDLDVNFNLNTSAEELVGMIRSTLGQD